VVVKSRFRYRGALDFLASIPIAIPGIVFGVGMIWAFIRTPLYGTTAILMLAYVTRYLPNGLRIVSSSLMQLSNELQEAARMSGASAMRSMFDILFPLMRPAILSTWVLLFINVVRELSATIMLYGPKSATLSVVLWDKMEGGQVADANVVALVLSALVFMAFFVASKVFKVDIVRGVDR